MSPQQQTLGTPPPPPKRDTAFDPDFTPDPVQKFPSGGGGRGGGGGSNLDADFSPDAKHVQLGKDVDIAAPDFISRAWAWLNAPLISEKTGQRIAGSALPGGRYPEEIEALRRHNAHEEFLSSKTEGFASKFHLGYAMVDEFQAGVGESEGKMVKGFFTPMSLGLAAITMGDSYLWDTVAGAHKMTKAAQMVAGIGFGSVGVVEAVTPRQPGETTADMYERRLSGASQALLSTAGEYASFKDGMRLWLRKKFKLNDDLAGQVSERVSKIQQARDLEASKITTIRESASAEQRVIDARKAQAVTAAELALEHNMAALEGQTSSRLSNIHRSIESESRQLTEKLGIAETEKTKFGKQILGDTVQTLVQEQARVSAPFREIGDKIKAPVTDTASIRSIINQELQDKGIKPEQLPGSATAAIGKPTSAETEIVWFGDKIKISDLSPGQAERFRAQGIIGDGGQVTFNDLTRIREDLYQSAYASKDSAIKSALFSAAEKVSDLQEAAADKNSLGSQYRKAKFDYLKFRRSIGSDLVADWIAARDVEDQAIAPKLAKLTNRANAEALRTVFKEAGIDTSQFDKALQDMRTAQLRQRQLAGERKADIAQAGQARAASATIQRKEAAGSLRSARAGASAQTRDLNAQTRANIAGATEETDAAVKELEGKGEIIPGKTTSDLSGKSQEDLLRMRLESTLGGARAGGVPNPGHLAMGIYGLIELVHGKASGAFPLAYALTRTEAAGLVTNPTFQDWLIRQSGVEPSNKLMVFKMRRAIAGLYPILRQAAGTQVPSAVIQGGGRGRPLTIGPVPTPPSRDKQLF